jgi:hypothetical protein
VGSEGPGTDPDARVAAQAVKAKRAKLEDEEEEFLYGHEPAEDRNRSDPVYKIVGPSAACAA